MADPDSVIQTLEAAAQVLLASPNVVSAEQRRQAENVFHQFRSTKNPYQLCREIMERPVTDYVLFESANLLKAALVREWTLLTESDISTLREYLLHYLLRKNTPLFLKEKILQTIAIIIKRCSIDDSGRERKVLLDELETIILSSPINQQKLACSLILAIVQEYAITIKSSDVGLIWDVHYRLKKNFEMTDLKRVFIFTLGVLQNIVTFGQRPEGEQAELTKQLLTIVETVLCWSHVSPLLTKRLIGAFESTYESIAPSLRMTATWRDTIFQPELLGLFFDVHMCVRSNPDLANHSIICLMQLASLSGVITYDKDLMQLYFDTYITGFLNMMQNIQPIDMEVLGISDIYRRLVQFFLPSMVATSPIAFLQHLTSFTCHSIRGAILEEGVKDDAVWRESLNKFLASWLALVTDSDGYSKETLHGPCVEIFNTYLQCRLAPPDGTRATENGNAFSDDIKDDEDERLFHSNDLSTIGAIARIAPGHCCNILNTLLQDRSKRLEERLQLLHMGKLPLSGGEQLISLFEDLHWILMFIRHFLAVDSTETSIVVVPSEIINYSIESGADVDASRRYLVGESDSTENVDPIIRLVAEVLKINTWECAALDAGLGAVFSPELSATLSWLLKNWADSYLMPEFAVSRTSPTFEGAWGRSSPGARWLMSRLLRRVQCCLLRLAEQPAAAQHALGLLGTLAFIRDRQCCVSNCEEFMSLVVWEATGSNLPGKLRKEMHRAFAVATTYAEGEVRNRLLGSTVALQEKLANIIKMESDTEPVRNMLADTLDCFIGVAEGLHEVEAKYEQYLMLLTALENIPGMIFRYHNYPTVVLPALQLLAKSTKRMLQSVQPQDASKFLDVCNATFEVYGRWNSGKISHIPLDAEEEAYEDICALMEVVYMVARCGGGCGACGVSATCARGLALVLPLVTPPLLSLPVLAAQAYLMLQELHLADQITTLPIEEFNSVVNALRVGLTAVSCDVSTQCCEIIVDLSSKVRRNFGDDSPYTMSLLSLAEVLLMLIIQMEIPPDSLLSAGAAIYSLTCVKPSLLEGLARQLIESCAVKDPTNVSRLEDAFSILTNGVLFDGLRQHRLRFQDNFDKFLANVHGFLMAK